jgi:hypothetical protein
MIAWLAENWITLAVYIILIAVIIFAVYKFVHLTKDQQKQRVVKWLLWTVSEAESLLGSGTGQLKLAEVYNEFIKAFPVVSSFVKYEVFSKWVDDVLDEMEDMISKNDKIADAILGEVEDTEED